MSSETSKTDSPNDKKPAEQRRSEQPIAPDAIGLLVGFLLAYGLTAARHLVGGDAGLFATLYADGGYAHPPGYPLYVLILRAFSWLPAATPFHGASLVTALLGATAVALLYVAARFWGASRYAGLLGAIAFGVSTHVWLMHTQPEVFALNNLFAALILGLAAPEGPARGTPRVLLLGVTAGLALSNHHTIALMAPIGLYGVGIGLREADALLRPLALGALALLVGLLPYTWLIYVSKTGAGWHWGEATDLQGLLHIFLRQDYGTFRMTAGEDPVGAGTQILFLGKAVLLDMYVLPVLLAVVGAVYSLRRPVDASSAGSIRGATLALLASLLLVGPLFVTRLTRVPDGLNYMLVRRFHLLPELLVAFLVALGANALRHRLRSPVIRAAIPAALVLTALPFVLEEQRVHHGPTVEQYLHDTFEPLPEDAVLVGTGDHHFFGSLYLQRALETRPDVTYVDAKLLVHRWYNRRTNRRLGIDRPFSGKDIDTDQLFAKVHATGRPLYLTHPFHERVLAQWPASPFGTTIKVHPPDRRPPSPMQVFEQNRRLLESLRIEPQKELPDHSWGAHVQKDYARTWQSIGEVLRRSGHPRAAARAEETAKLFGRDP